MAEGVHIWHSDFFGVSITTMVSKYGCDIRIKAQGQLYLKSVLWNVTRAPLSFLTEGLIFGKMSAYDM